MKPVLLLLALHSTQFYAQDSTQFSNPYQLSEVVVTNANAQFSRLSGNFNLITANDLSAGNQTNLPYYLNQVPGVQVQAGALNTFRVVIRGIGSRSPYATNRIKVYFDEIPLTTGEGITGIEDIDIATIDNISIIKGPSSALYGAGLGGVIRFAPVRANTNQVSLNSEAGSFGTFKNTLNASAIIGKVGISGLFSNMYSDGFRENSRYKRNTLFLKGSASFNKSSLRIILHGIDLNSRIPSSIDETTFRNRPQAAAANWKTIKGFEKYQRLLTGITYSFPVANRLTNQATLFGSFIDHYESRPFNILEDNSYNYGLRDKITLSLGKQSFVAGMEWFNEFYRWKIFESQAGLQGSLINLNKEKRSYLNIFTLWYINIKDKLFVDAGLNYAALRYKLSDLFADTTDHSGSRRYKPVVSPRIGLNYQLNKNLNLYTSAGHGFSPPTLEETLLPQGQPNPDLKPEDGYEIEIGARFSMFNQRIFLEATQYWLFLENLLVSKRITEEIFTGENLGKTNHYGTEILLKWRTIPDLPGKRTALEITASHITSSNRFSTFVNLDNSFEGNRLPGIPSNTTNISVLMRLLNNLRLDLNYQLIGNQFLNDANTNGYSGHQLLGLKTEYSLMLKKLNIRVYMGAQNVLNEDYAAMVLVNAPQFGTTQPRYYYPGDPRSIFGGITVILGR